MTQVRCSAKSCEHNEGGICKLPCIDLEESDMQYKDCGQSKERKDEPQSEDDEYWLSLLQDVVDGKMSAAGANQAWYEYINHKDEPQIDCKTCKHSSKEEESDECYTCSMYYNDNYEPQTGRSE